MRTMTMNDPRDYRQPTYLANYVDPISADDAEARRATLVAEVMHIQAQLSEKNRTFDGRRLDDREYHAWRAGAVRALSHKVAHLSQLKAWISRHYVKPAMDSGHATILAQMTETFRDVKDILSQLAEQLAAIERLRGAITAALDSAESEGVDEHRGTDEPREFARILREAIGQ